jgi:putative endonuclease
LNIINRASKPYKPVDGGRAKAMMAGINIGQWAEQLALAYLSAQGLDALAQNYHSRYGEIDLIMQEEGCICFIEVKARRTNSMVDGFEAVDLAKQQRNILTAQCYLQQYERYQALDCRFDVLVVQYTKPVDFEQHWRRLLQQNTVNLQWLRHAYTL